MINDSISYTNEDSDWILYYSEEGYPYYYNQRTGESQWAVNDLQEENELEINPASRNLYSDEDEEDDEQNNVYYRNNSTNVFINQNMREQIQYKDNRSTYDAEDQNHNQVYDNDDSDDAVNDNDVEEEEEEDEDEVDEDEEEFQDYLNTPEGQQQLANERRYVEQYTNEYLLRQMMNKKDDKESQFPVEPLRLNTKDDMKPLAVQRRVTEKRPVHPVHPIGDEEDLRRDGDAFDDISSDDSDVELMIMPVVPPWFTWSAIKTSIQAVWRDPVASSKHVLGGVMYSLEVVQVYASPTQNWIIEKTCNLGEMVWTKFVGVAKVIVDGNARQDDEVIVLDDPEAT